MSSVSSNTAIVHRPRSRIQPAINVTPPGTPVNRFYMPWDTVADVTPADGVGVWDASPWFNRQLTVTKTDTAIFGGNAVVCTNTLTYYGSRRYVSDELSAQTISGNVKMQLMSVGGAVQSVNGAYEIYVVDSTGVTVRGTLLAQGYRAALLETTYHNHIWIPAATPLTPLVVQTGDRLVLAIGFYSTVAPNQVSCGMWGDPIAGVDLDEDDIDTDTSKVSWIEFSSAIYVP